MMWWYGNGMSGWGWFWMVFSMVVFWGLLITLAVVLARALNRPGGPPPDQQQPRPTPEQLLAERFARGEIDEGEYHRRLDALRQHGQAVGPPR